MQARCMVALCIEGMMIFVSGRDYRSTEASSAVAYNRNMVSLPPKINFSTPPIAPYKLDRTHIRFRPCLLLLIP